MPTTREKKTARVGLEPTTLRLTVGRLAIELLALTPYPRVELGTPSLGKTGLHPAGKGNPSGWSRTTTTDVRSISAISVSRGKSTGKVLPLL